MVRRLLGRGRVEGHCGKSELRISEAWTSQNLVALRDRRAGFPFRFLPSFSKAQSIGMVFFDPLFHFYGVAAASQAVPNSVSFTISGCVSSLWHSIYFPRLPVHSKAKFSLAIPKVCPWARPWVRLRVPVSAAHTPTQREGSLSWCCVPACAALGTRPTAHGGSCAKIQVTSWRWLLCS